MLGGAVGGIRMALMEDLAIDHRFRRPINNNLADYHAPVNADIPNIDVFFVNKKIHTPILWVRKDWEKLH
jgi:xanthine dehydrogenase YagR molybdenum-binding subunit